MDTLLTVDQAAEAMGTTSRFIRRLIAERRIAYTKLGRHVRIAESDLINYVTAGRVVAHRGSLAALPRPASSARRRMVS